VHAKNSQIHKFSQAYHGWPRSVGLFGLLTVGCLAPHPWLLGRGWPMVWHCISTHDSVFRPIGHHALKKKSISFSYYSDAQR
jgi:hypothetical protein